MTLVHILHSSKSNKAKSGYFLVLADLTAGTAEEFGSEAMCWSSLWLGLPRVLFIYVARIKS